MTTAPALAPQSIALMRKVFALLEEHFGTELRAYVGDWSDAKIAKQLNTSEAGVKKYRIDGGFGKIAPPNEFAVLKADLEELQGLFVSSEATIKEKLADIAARLRTVERKFD